MTLLILNDAPYGNERTYNGLRLAQAMAKSGQEVRLFLLADAIFCGLKNQKTPSGFYNIGIMLRSLLKREVRIYA